MGHKIIRQKEKETSDKNLKGRTNALSYEETAIGKII